MPRARMPISHLPFRRRFPDLERFDSVEDSRHAWHSATAFIYESHWYWFFTLTLGIPVGGPAIWLCRRRIECELRRELCRCGRVVCLRCGYDLRGQIEPRCPECGQRAESLHGAVQPRE